MPAINVPQPEFMDDEEIAIFADAVGKFYQQHAPEKRVLKWREDGQVERAVEAIQQAAHTGRIGDGKIFVCTVEEALRIRTGEKGAEAL